MNLAPLLLARSQGLLILEASISAHNVHACLLSQFLHPSVQHQDKVKTRDTLQKSVITNVHFFTLNPK